MGVLKMQKIYYAILLIILSSLVSASFISMSTTSSTRTTEEVIELNISTINKGDEAAHNVQFNVESTRNYTPEKWKELWFDTERVVENFIKSIDGRKFLAESFLQKPAFPMLRLFWLSFIVSQNHR